MTGEYHDTCPESNAVTSNGLVGWSAMSNTSDGNCSGSIARRSKFLYAKASAELFNVAYVIHQTSKVELFSFLAPRLPATQSSKVVQDTILFRPSCCSHGCGKKSSLNLDAQQQINGNPSPMNEIPLAISSERTSTLSPSKNESDTGSSLEGIE